MGDAVLWIFTISFIPLIQRLLSHTGKQGPPLALEFEVFSVPEAPKPSKPA